MKQKQFTERKKKKYEGLNNYTLIFQRERELGHKRACKFYWFNEQIVFLIVIAVLHSLVTARLGHKVQVAFEWHMASVNQERCCNTEQYKQTEHEDLAPNWPSQNQTACAHHCPGKRLRAECGCCEDTFLSPDKHCTRVLGLVGWCSGNRLHGLWSGRHKVKLQFSLNSYSSLSDCTTSLPTRFLIKQYYYNTPPPHWMACWHGNFLNESFLNHYVNNHMITHIPPVKTSRSVSSPRANSSVVTLAHPFGYPGYGHF